MRKLLVSALLLPLAACTAAANQAATPTRPESLTPMTLSTDAPRHMKSAGQVFVVVDRQTVWIRVDPGNVNLQVPLNGALIALRTDAKTGYAKVNVGLSSVSDLHVGDRVTFAFDPGSRDAQGSYLATVIGR